MTWCLFVVHVQLFAFLLTIALIQIFDILSNCNTPALCVFIIGQSMVNSVTQR